MKKSESTAEKPKAPMKTLANCTPVEFLRQTNKIRHAVANLWEDSGAREIRERGKQEIREQIPQMTGKETKQEKEALLEKRKALLRKQGKKILNDILDALMEKNAEQTINVLGMMCFMEPEEIQKTPISKIVTAAFELLNNQPVKDFLWWLVKSVLMSTDD